MQASVTIEVQAPAERVFSLITDITRMGEWSPETIRAEWLPPSDRAALGARFAGTNRAPKGTEWTTECEIVEYEPGRAFAFQVQRPDGLGSTWGYRITGDHDRCQVEEHFHSPRRMGLVRRLLTKLVMGIGDRASHNETTMRATLERLKAAAEAGG